MTRFSSKNRIKWKLTLVIMGTSAIVLTLAGAAVLIYDSINSRHNLVSHVNTLAEITGANSAAAMTFANARDAQETLDALRSRDEIIFAGLYTSEGDLFVHFAREGREVPLTLPPNAEGNRFESHEFIVTQRIFSGQDTAGFISLRADFREQRKRFKGLITITSLTLLGLLGVALVLASRLQRLVSNPILQLASVADRITQQKDYGVRARKESDDEIGSLVDAFNQMLSEIERQNHTLRESEERFRTIAKATNDAVWDWNLTTNRIWWNEGLAELFGYPPDSGQADPAWWLERVHPDERESLRRFLIDAANDPKNFWADEYRFRRADGSYANIFERGHAIRDASGKTIRMIGAMMDITLRKQAEADRQRLVGQLLHTEDDERRRIARELHDTTAQHLAAIKMSLTQRIRENPSKPVAEQQWIADNLQLVEQSVQEIRTLTYVLHPPLLDELGLVGAIQDYAAGMEQRSGLHVSVDADAYYGRLSRELELVLFRVIQESLTNVLRHSESKSVVIQLERDDDEVRVEIQDFGRGLPGGVGKPDTKFLKRTGVGIATMRERLRHVGGRLAIESDPEGVTVLAVVPVPRESEATPEKQTS